MPEDSTIDTIAMELLAGVPPQDPPEEQASPEVQDPPEEQGELDPQVHQAVMTEEFVEANGLPNFFVGKPFDELAKSYSHANRKLSQLPPKHEKAAPPQEQEPQEDMPDPVEDLDAYKQWLQKRFNQIREDARKEALQQVTPELEVVARMKQQEQIAYINSQLLKEFSPDEIEEISKEYLQMPGVQEYKIPIYREHPDLLIQDLTLFGKAKKLPNMAKAKGKEVVDRLAQQVKTSAPVKSPSIVKPSGGQTRSSIDDIADDLMAGL